MGIVHLKHWKLCLLLFVLLIYAFVLEPNILMVERLKLSDTPSLKIAFFADIHIWIQKPLHSLFLNELRQEKVDLILFGGDVLSPYTDMKYFAELFTELASIAPIYAVYGNWEESETAVVDRIFKQAGVQVLHTRSTTVEVRGKKIGITGAPSHHYFSWTRFLPEEEFDLKILMVHAPNMLEGSADILKKYDLVLAGHTHGGQFYFPWITEWVLKSTRGFSGRYFRGMYKLDETKIYVTRGLGGWFPGRFASLPELVIIEL